MAVANFDEMDGAEDLPRGVHLQGLINLAGALTSLVLVIGVAVWGYRLVERDVNGVPVIQALKGPMRIAPEDPGGQIAGDLGLSVNRVAAGQPDQTGQGPILLAPAPGGLTAQDIAPENRPAQIAPAPDQGGAAPGAAGAATGTAAAAATNAAPPEVSATSGSTPGSVATTAVGGGSETTTAGASAPGAAVSGGTAGAAAGGAAMPPPETVASLLIKTAPPIGPEAVATSPRPMPRPARPMTASGGAAAAVEPAVHRGASGGDNGALEAAIAAAAGAVASAPVQPREVSAASLPAGTRLVQFGAYDSTAAARARWAALESRYGALMADKSMVIQSATSGGRAFYRLRAYGFASDADSRRFCSALLFDNTACVPVVLR